MDFKSDTYPPVYYNDFVTKHIMVGLDEIVSKLPNPVKCPCCGKVVDYNHVDIYDHSGGWFVCADIPKQWLSVHCDNCNYDISFTKLGVSRP